MTGLPLNFSVDCILPMGSTFRSETYLLTDVFSIHLKFCSIANFLACLPTVLLNALVVTSVIKSHNLHAKSKAFIISLGVSDFAAGLISQPVFAVYLYHESYGMTNCIRSYISYLLGVPLTLVSVTTVAGIAFERYLALFKPYFYQRHVTSQRIIKFLLTVWFFNAATCFVLFGVKKINILTSISAFVFIVTFCLNLFVYLKIYGYVKQLRRRIEIENMPLGHTGNSDRSGTELPIKMSMGCTSQYLSQLPKTTTCDGEHTKHDSSHTLPKEASPKSPSHFSKRNVSKRSALLSTESLSSCHSTYPINTSGKPSIVNVALVGVTGSPSSPFVISMSSSRVALGGNNETRIQKVENSKLGRTVSCPVLLSEVEESAKFSTEGRKSSLRPIISSSFCDTPSPSCEGKRKISKQLKKTNNENRRLAVFTISIVGALLLTYFPFLMGRIVRASHMFDTTTLRIYDCYSFTILLLNSLMNPIILCIQCPPIERAIRQLFLRCHRSVRAAIF